MLFQVVFFKAESEYQHENALSLALITFNDTTKISHHWRQEFPRAEILLIPVSLSFNYLVNTSPLRTTLHINKGIKSQARLTVYN